MKKLIILFIFFFPLSCNSVLEEEIVSGITADSHYTNATGWEDGAKAAYFRLRNFYGREEGFTVSVFGTDIFTKGADGSHKYINDYTAELNPDAAFFRNIWNWFYEAINTCNTVIDYAENDLVTGLNEDVKKVRLGEVRFLRALYYFNLVQMYGDVHLTLEGTKGVETEANRTPANQVYEQAIIPDLEYAIANLPAKASDYGRITKPAAEAILARVHLVRQNWPQAALLAKNVINNYDFELVPKWGEIWNQDNELNPEVVWSVQYTADPLTNDGGSRGHLYFLQEYDKTAGLQRDITNGRPWKRFQPTRYLLDLYDVSKDRRYYEGFKEVWYANNPATLPEGMQLGDTAFYVVTYAVPDEIQKSKPYFFVDYDPNSQDPVMQLRQINKRWFPSLNKFIDPKRITVQQEQGSRDFMVVRLAEMYLLAAEALMNDDKKGEAVEYMNVLRRRAAWPGKEKEMEITEAQLDLNFILDERARELAGEKFRWFDLKRTGTLLSRVKQYNEDAAPNIKDFHVLRPIPRDQIDRTTVPYAQNTGY
ncbi:MAG: RagB/SusD family nutrient uptake outer membrane protein [Candidatus Cyclobacteriaceae bacterium M3_2C_046]